MTTKKRSAATVTQKEEREEKKEKFVVGPSSYFKAARPWSLTAALTSVLVGTALAYRETHAFDLFNFVIVVVGALSTQSFANLINSYYDFKFGVDKKETADDRTLFDLGLTTETVNRMILFFLTVCFVCALLLCVRIGDLPVITEHLMPLILIGALIAIFYTAAPVSLKYIGLGDVAIIAAFGPLLVQGAFVAQTNFSSHLAYYYSIPIALTIEAILHVNNTRDIEYDQVMGGFTLATKLGVQKCFYLFVFLFGAAYTVLFFLSIEQEGMLFLNTPAIILPMLPKLFQLFNAKQFPYLCERTGQFSFLFGILYSIGILLSRAPDEIYYF